MNSRKILISGIIALGIIVIVGLLIFGSWSYSSYLDSKSSVDQKINQAIVLAKQQQASVDSKKYATESQYPLANYTGPQIYGSLSVNYPKNWSAYVDDTGSNNLVDGYFNPGYVPAIGGSSSTFALRVKIINQTYATTLTNLSSEQQAGLITVKPYSLPKVSKVVGVMITGQVQNNLNGEMVILPLRNETLQVWTVGTNYMTIFNNVILANLTFSP